MTDFEHTIDSPIGPLRIVVDEDGTLNRLVFLGDSTRQAAAGAGSNADRCAHVVAQLEEYFAGQRRDFDLVLAPQGTGFQRRVWAELQEIPFGTTISYGELAKRLGQPSASRAVGTANGANPIPVVIPCHRVIGADGSLTGFGGGLEAKAALLELEGALPAGSAQGRLEFA